MPYDKTRTGGKKFRELEKIGALWMKTSAAEGKKYQSGVVGLSHSDDDIVLHKGDKILIYANKHRANENSPWYYLFREKPDEPEEEEEMPLGAQEDDAPSDEEEPKKDDDDIQF